MKLLRTFPKVAFEFGLASWRWMGLREQTPRFATCFGDIFLESLDGWWFLDTVEGTLELRWNSAVTMYAELESPEGRATYLMDDLVREARGRGMLLGEEDVYTFNPHPAVGGELGVDGLSTMRFELALNWVGQMHDSVLHSSGEIRLPPLPDGDRRAAAAPVNEPWDSAWAHDETFDVPFEQYLATTTFAAVSAPRRTDDGYPPLPPPARREDPLGQTPHGAQDHGTSVFGSGSLDTHGYVSPGYGGGALETGFAPGGGSRPRAGGRHGGAPADDTPAGGSQFGGSGQAGPVPGYETPGAPELPWSQETVPAQSPWSGQTEAAQPWLEPHQTAQPATPPGGYDAAPYDQAHQAYPAAPEAYGAAPAAEQPVQYDDQPWGRYQAAQGPAPDPFGQTAPVWDAPAWGGQPQAPAG
ncbi:hypothetical protein, partial [Promicromonospora kroppenstedtii]|uniref:hypothetical protein n=1 Tax=Promicromonospora kroppenstedtii TaxID=440482 RepID=UPI001B7FB6CD